MHADRSQIRANNFDGVRLVAALMVLVGHGFVLTGAGRAPTLFGIPIHTLAVAVFFAISGYLIAGSWAASPHPGRFLWHRFLRIFPGLIAVVIVTVGVIGPLATTNLHAYLASPKTYDYLQNITTLAVYELPGVFTSDTHATRAVNGSLWTLGVEFACYLAVLGVGMLAKKHRGVVYLVLALLAVAVTSLLPFVPALTSLRDAAPVVVYFFIGSLIRTSAPALMLSWRVALPVAVVWFATTLFWSQAALVASWLALPLCVLALGRASTPVLRRASRFGDLSYGTYLWAFVLQQSALDLFGRLPIGVNLAIVLPATIAVAFGSWYLVEARFLRLKRYSPFRPWRGVSPTRAVPALEGG